MKLMVVGSGGREHALGWKLAASNLVDEMIFVPGNAGMRELGECVEADVNDAGAVADIATARGVDLTVVGPEAPLVEGLVDHFEDKGLTAFGPTREAARLEGSKQFAKSVMERHGVSTGRAKMFDDFDAAREYVVPGGCEGGRSCRRQRRHHSGNHGRGGRGSPPLPGR